MAKQKMQIAKFTAIFEPADEGGYVVTVPALPGCVTEGDTLEEAVEMAKDAVAAYVASLRKHGEPVPEEHKSFIGLIDVPVPVAH